MSAERGPRPLSLLQLAVLAKAAKHGHAYGHGLTVASLIDRGLGDGGDPGRGLARGRFVINDAGREALAEAKRREPTVRYAEARR